MSPVSALFVTLVVTLLDDADGVIVTGGSALVVTLVVTLLDDVAGTIVTGGLPLVVH